MRKALFKPGENCCARPENSAASHITRYGRPPFPKRTGPPASPNFVVRIWESIFPVADNLADGLENVPLLAICLVKRRDPAHSRFG
jgi:hypothetical protein